MLKSFLQEINQKLTWAEITEQKQYCYFRLLPQNEITNLKKVNMEQKTKVTASDVAKYIIAELQESEDLVTNMRVQHLLYLAQCWYLSHYNKPLFAEDLQAWVLGAVQPEVYDQYKEYQWRPILREVKHPKIKSHIAKYIDEVLERYGDENAFSLELMVRKSQPWLEARGDLPEDADCKNVISLETMKNSFADCHRA